MVKLNPKEVEARTKYLDEIPRVMAVVNPDKYASNKDEVKEAIKENGLFIALGVAKGKAEEEHELIYDSSSESLEPVYFWILDLMNKLFSSDVKKIVDNFSSTPGSGHFSELQQKATIMQGEVSKIMGNINIVIKSIINLIYDLKDFKMRLAHYEESRSKDANRALAGLLALKQIWLDNVDMKRGNGAIHAMAQQLGFTTLRDAFLSAKSVNEAAKIDLNERVKRVLIPRVQEFFTWKDISETELKKRYSIERTYLKSQVESLRLYTRWAKPYLRAASKLEMKNMDSPEMVTGFNTIVFQLTLFAKRAVKVEDLVDKRKLPEKFKKVKMRKMYSCVAVDFTFRGIPSRAGQHYTFGGRTRVNFRGYVLNEEELKMFEKMLEQSDLNDALGIAEGITTESLQQIQEDVDYFLNDKSVSEEKNKEKRSDDVNPFFALFSFLSKNPDEKSEKKKKEPSDSGGAGIKTPEKEDHYEKLLRKEFAEKMVKELCFDIFDIYKKAHGMASHPSPYS